MKFELCAASIEAIQLAKQHNFNRIELCQSLEQGGLTPSYGMIEYAQAFGIETHVLIRPRPGGFVYSRDEIDVVLREIISCKRIGVKGIVVGALKDSGEIDSEIMKEMIDKAEGLDVTFHRAFDDSIEWKPSLEILINLGVERVLSSGLATNIENGMPVLKQMVQFADSNIEIMAGGGVNAANVCRLIEDVQPDAIHFSGTSKFDLDEDSFFSESILKVDAKKVQRILDVARIM